MGTTYANLRNQVLGGDPAAAGKFSLARKRKSGRAREYLLRAQCIARVGETREDVLVRNARVILQDIGFAPPVGHQPDHEFDRKSRAANDRLPSEHFGRERDARMLHHELLATPFSELTLYEPGV